MKIILCLYLAALSALIFSCEKNNTDSPSPGVNKASTEKASAWYEHQVKITKPVIASLETRLELSMSRDKPAWNKISYYAALHTIIIPLQSAGKQAGKNVKVAGYLVLKENTAGGIESDGFYYVVQPLTSKTWEVTPALLYNRLAMGDFTGSIMRYNFDGSLAESRSYNNGVPEMKEARLLQRAANNQTQGLMPLADGCAYVTIDWYWQTFENGVLVQEEYLFSSTEVVCDGGSGGGGTQTGNIDQLFEQGVAAGHSVSIKTGETTIDIDATHRLKKYDWKFYENKGVGYVYYFSREHGYQEKQSNGKWIFTSLEHNSIWKVSDTPNWDIICTIATATPTIGGGVLASWASMQLEFNINYKFQFGTYNRNRDARDHNGCLWHADQGTIVPLPPVEG